MLNYWSKFENNVLSYANKDCGCSGGEFHLEENGKLRIIIDDDYYSGEISEEHVVQFAKFILSEYEKRKTLIKD